MTHAVVALGANLGDRRSTLRDAVRGIGALDGVVVDAVSGLYESVAVRLTGVDFAAPGYLNAVLTATTTMPPEELLTALHAIEDAHGRVRAERWGDRTLDLDLIAVDGISSTGAVELPHPRAGERAFVLAPWAEIEPDAVLPGAGPVADLLARAEGPVPRRTEEWPW